MEELTNLDYNPVFRQLLINYVSRKYEEAAEYDDWNLFQEYLWLEKNNLLNELAKEECLTNKLNDENYRCGNDRR